jgi:tetratricopeptide (TPR) repeat protein
MRRALAIDEESLGPVHPNVALRLNNLADLLQDTYRLAEAEPLMRRALTIDEKSLGLEHPNVARDLNNLADLLRATNRFAEAEPLMRRALSIIENAMGPEHPNVAICLDSLANLLFATNRLAEAEPLMRRALAIDEKSFGPEHPQVAKYLNNLADPLQATNRLAEAEPLMRRSLAIGEKSLGSGHPDVAIRLTNLALLRAERGDWAEAAALGERTKPALVARKAEEGGDRTGITKAELVSNTWALRAHARAQHRANPNSAAAREEGFELAQWALQTGAADAVAQMSVRLSKGPGPLASLVRERQDLLSRRQGEMRRLDAAAGRADAKTAEDTRVALVGVDKRLDAIDVRLTTEFTDYAELANPKPLTIAAVQALLRPDEAVVVLLDVPRFQFVRLPEETLAWIVTKQTSRWRSIALGTDALRQRVGALRCGLDGTAWNDDGAERCAKALQRTAGKVPNVGEPLPFDLTRAHALYESLFGPEQHGRR